METAESAHADGMVSSSPERPLFKVRSLFGSRQIPLAERYSNLDNE